MNEINFEIQDIEKIDLSMDVGVKEIFPPIENLEVTPTKEQQVFTHENSYGYDNVIVKKIGDEYIIPVGILDVDANGDVDVTMFKTARVGVYTPPNLQDKVVTPNKNTQTITSDEGYDGLNEVKVNPIPNSYIEPSGTLPITENGTYDVTQYAEVITNIESSGGATLEATTLEELKTKVSEITTSYVDNACKMHDINEPYVNTPVTFYSPAATHKYYFIRKRAEGYQAVWSPSPCISVSKGRSDIYMEEISYEVATKNGIGYLTKDPVYRNTEDAGYRGSFYSTVEECIASMQNPNTSYTRGTVGGWSAIMLEDTIVPCSNCACYWKDSSTDEYTPCPTRRASKDETIEVIS